MSEHAKIIYNGNEYELPVIVGAEGERAIDISQLRAQPTTRNARYASRNV